jgi:hypothetical protein
MNISYVYDKINSKFLFDTGMSNKEPFSWNYPKENSEHIELIATYQTLSVFESVLISSRRSYSTMRPRLSTNL